MEDTTSPKEYGLVQGSRVMFMSIGTGILEKEALNSHRKLRQLSEMVQSPEVARDKVWVLRLLREAHIWEKVTLGGQVGGSNGGDRVGEGEGDGEGEDEGEGEGEGDGRAVEVGKVGLEDGQLAAQCM